jgi:hypothetical protein
MPRLDSLASQLMVLFVLILGTAVIAIYPWSRHAIAQLAQIAGRLLRAASSLVAKLFDLVVPINRKNGRVPPIRWFALCMFNLGALAFWLSTSSRSSSPQAANTAGLVDAFLASLNLLFLIGAYWALREGITIMNGDQPYRRRQFADLSTAKNAVMVCTASVLLILQIAALLQWLQEVHELRLLEVKRSLGTSYLDFLVATLNGLPFASFYVGTPGLADHVAFTAGIGSWCFKAINALGSVLLVSTIIGFVQQHIAFRKMIDDLLTKTDGKLLLLLRARFLRAPSAIKSYVRAAFQTEADNNKRLKLVQLAVDKHSYSFPAVFIRAYPKLSNPLRLEGAPIIADFLERKGHQFDSEALVDITDAISWVYSTGAITERGDREQVGFLVLPCLERLCDPNKRGVDGSRAGYQIVRRKPFQTLLSVLLNAGVDKVHQKRAVDLLIMSRAQDALPEMLRRLQHMSDSMRIWLLQGAKQIVLDRGITFAFSDDNDPLGETIRTIDWNVHNVALSPAAHAALRHLREAAVERRSAKRKVSRLLKRTQ